MDGMFVGRTLFLVATSATGTDDDEDGIGVGSVDGTVIILLLIGLLVAGRIGGAGFAWMVAVVGGEDGVCTDSIGLGRLLVLGGFLVGRLDGDLVTIVAVLAGAFGGGSLVVGDDTVVFEASFGSRQVQYCSTNSMIYEQIYGGIYP